MWRENTGFLFRKTTFLRCADSWVKKYPLVWRKTEVEMERKGGRGRGVSELIELEPLS